MIASGSMGLLQIIVVAITVGLTALDGFDVLSSSFASPGIAAEWHVQRDALGVLLSMDLLGMAVGSIVLGGVADNIGRRPTSLGCLLVMAVGMFLATRSHDVVELSAYRVLTGLGIGGLLAATNAVVAEFSNSRSRNLCVSLMSIGYPLGGVLGGLVVARLLQNGDWRSVFYFGAVITALFLPLVALFVPESVHWLTQKQPPKALERVNRALQRMGRDAVAALPAIAPEVRKRSIGDLFTPALIATTVLTAVAYFFHVVSFYFVVKWVPKIVVDMHFAPSLAAQVLVWANIGGATGGAVLGLLSLRFGVKPLTIIVMILSAVTVTIFGRSPPDLQRLELICACAGFCTNAGIVGMYAIFAQAFPTHVRASGTGFAIGLGRGGSILAPMIAGFLFQGGYPLPTVAMIMGASALVAAVVLSFLKLRPEVRLQPEAGAPPLRASA
jgi:benzoate transport